MMQRLRGATSFLVLLLLTAATSLAITGCAGGPKKPTLEVAEVRVADIDRESVQLTVTLNVKNNNAVELSVSDIQATLFLADQNVGTAQAVQPRYTLPASGSVMLPLRVRVPIKTLPDALRKGALALINGGMPYKITGSVTTFNGLVTIPFEKSGDVAKRR